MCFPPVCQPSATSCLSVRNRWESLVILSIWENFTPQGLDFSLAYPWPPSKTHRHAVHFACDVSIPPGSEDGAGAGVGVEEGEVFWSKDKTPIGILQLLGAIEEESKLCLGTGAVCPVSVSRQNLIRLSIRLGTFSRGSQSHRG